jgi:uncharacterized delta-60 repeat protein
MSLPSTSLPVVSRTLIQALEPRQLLSAGAFDPFFSGDGQARVDFGGGIIGNATDVVVQSDGKTIVVGQRMPGSAAYVERDHFYLARFNVDGSIDATYGAARNGRVVVHVGDTDKDSAAYAATLQNDGKLVVVGIADDEVFGSPQFGVARFNSNGTLDTSFSEDGKATIEFNDAFATAIAIQSDGKIVIGGSDFNGTGLSKNTDFALARLNANGSLDTSFNSGVFSGGKKTVGLGADEELSDLKIDYSGTAASNPNYGKIYAVGTKTTGDDAKTLALVRLKTNGTLDTNFQRNGASEVRFPNNVSTSGRALVIQPDGKIVVAGSANSDPVMLRVYPSGVWDTKFGKSGTGWVSADFGGVDFASDLMRSYDGGLILSGISMIGTDGKVAFASYNANGKLNAAFGTRGTLRTTFTGGAQMAAGPAAGSWQRAERPFKRPGSSTQAPT